MNIHFLKKICFVLLASLFVSSTGKIMAQVEDSHFIYIQAENRKPFYVILDEKLYSSSSIGYLIIPKLKNGTYNLTLGFPQNAAPEQRFVTVVRNNDIGYSLKSVDNNTFTLTDLQTQQVLTANGKAPAAPTRNTEPAIARTEPEVSETPLVTETTPTIERTTSPIQEEKTVVAEEPRKNRTFGDLMSSVSNDPNLAKRETAPATPKTPARDPFEDRLVRTTDKPVETPVARETTPVQKPITAPVQTERVVTTTTNVVPSSATFADTYGVVRTRDQDANGGRSMSFILLSTTHTDSVSIFVPYDEEQKNPTQAISVQSAERKRSIAYFDYADLAQTPPPANTSGNRRKNNNDEKFLNNNATGAQQSNQSAEVHNPFYSAQNTETKEDKQRSDNTLTSPPTATTHSLGNNSACSAGSISDRDFSKMRNKMIGRDNDDDMVSTAMDMLGNKCISTANVKTLGGLFITDNGRLKFFAAIKKNIFDVENFSTLEEQIYDRGKKEQFRSLL